MAARHENGVDDGNGGDSHSDLDSVGNGAAERAIGSDAGEREDHLDTRGADTPDDAVRGRWRGEDDQSEDAEATVAALKEGEYDQSEDAEAAAVAPKRKPRPKAKNKGNKTKRTRRYGSGRRFAARL